MSRMKEKVKVISSLYPVINRPGVARAVLQTPLSLIQIFKKSLLLNG